MPVSPVTRGASGVPLRLARGLSGPGWQSSGQRRHFPLRRQLCACPLRCTRHPQPGGPAPARSCTDGGWDGLWRPSPAAGTPPRASLPGLGPPARWWPSAAAPPDTGPRARVTGPAQPRATIHRPAAAWSWGRQRAWHLSSSSRQMRSQATRRGSAQRDRVAWGTLPLSCQAVLGECWAADSTDSTCCAQTNPRPSLPATACPGGRRPRAATLPAAASSPERCGYLDGLGHRRPLLGAASGHVQEEGLQPAWQGQLVVSGDTGLGCCPQDCGHTVHRGLGTTETGRAQWTCPSPGCARWARGRGGRVPTARCRARA